MPSPIVFFKTDPNKMGRGRGIYYKRGNFKPKSPFKTFKGKYFSKFDPQRDFKIKAKGWKIDRVGINLKGDQSSIAQAGDGRKTR